MIEYDFIIVGAGSAGAVVANRLSEKRNWTILLLEAGGDETEISDIPSLAGYLQLTDLDWQYKTSPPTDSPYCLAMIGDRCNWPRGKVLGGSSVLNAMIYVRGNRLDYDQWAALGTLEKRLARSSHRIERVHITNLFHLCHQIFLPSKT